VVARGAVIGAAGAVAIGAALGLGNMPDDADAPGTGDTALDAMFHERSGQAASRGGIGRAPVTAPAASLAQAPEASPTPATPTHAVSAAPVAGCESYTGNRLLGCNLLSEFGFGVDQMASLDRLWTHESGWNHTAENPYSGAYGIPQALPGSKMSSHGDDWQTNPETQIRWGLDYIKNRYGSPDAAYSFFQSNGWY
jgi:hypothetical protein